MAEFYLFEEFGVAYMSTPKVASSTILNAFAVARGWTTGEEAHALNFEKVDAGQVDPHEYHRFVVVRNPYDRIVSYWANTTGDNFQYLSPAAFERGMEGIHQGMPFFDFFQLAMQRPDGACNPHLTSLYHRTGEFSMLDRILRYETLDSDWELLCATYRRVPPLRRRLNASKRGPWLGYYNQKMLDQVYERYEMDFKMLGYRRAYAAD